MIVIEINSTVRAVRDKLHFLSIVLFVVLSVYLSAHHVAFIPIL